MNILSDIQELLKEGVITEETAEKIRAYYGTKTRSDSSTNRLLIVFGILGAVLIGLGIILIIAHNWDELTRSTKTLFAFLPLLSAQLLCVYVLIKRVESTAWRESASALLFFAIGSSIALVSQIYHIPGGTGTFILTWMLLSLPVVYLMNSSVTSLFYISGITYYAIKLSYWTYPSSDSYLYWLLLLFILPHYYLLFKKNPRSNFIIFHDWVIPISLIITLGSLADNNEELMFIAYFSLFGLFYLLGSSNFFLVYKPRYNFYKIAGSIGTIVMLLMLSFDWFWDQLTVADLKFNEIFVSPEFIVSFILTVPALWLLYLHTNGRDIGDVKPMGVVFLLFIFTFIIGMYSIIAVVIINFILFGLGILTIRHGAKEDNLGKLNYGLLIITALVICRFFDTDLSFIIRGILFLLVGAGFFAVNYFMLNKRKINEQ